VESGQQPDGVVVEDPPLDGIEVAKDGKHLGMPTPPQVASQGHALLVQRLGGEADGGSHVGAPTGHDFHVTHDRLLPKV